MVIEVGHFDAVIALLEYAGCLGSGGAVTAVVVDDDAFRHSAAEHPAFFDRLDLAGAAGMDRRGDKAVRFGEQKARCLDAAAQGAVLISACISPKEREIINESVHRGFPTIVIHDNGFPDRYHPSAESLALCASGRLLLVSPWKYQYRGKDEQVTVPLCKAMNCVAQALCRTKDSWWKVCS